MFNLAEYFSSRIAELLTSVMYFEYNYSLFVVYYSHLISFEVF